MPDLLNLACLQDLPEVQAAQKQLERWWNEYLDTHLDLPLVRRRFFEVGQDHAEQTLTVVREQRQKLVYEPLQFSLFLPALYDWDRHDLDIVMHGPAPRPTHHFAASQVRRRKRKESGKTGPSSQPPHVHAAVTTTVSQCATGTGC